MMAGLQGYGKTTTLREKLAGWMKKGGHRHVGFSGRITVSAVNQLATLRKSIGAQLYAG